jgi:hypothetical protein
VLFTADCYQYHNHVLAQAQSRCFAWEDEIRDENSDGVPKEYGLRTFIPPSLTASDEYWHHVATKCFALSTQLGPPTFFLTFTMNPYWSEYQALRRTGELFRLSNDCDRLQSQAFSLDEVH